MNRKYNLKLDLQFRCNNSKMIFDEFDENTSDFFMQINRQGQEVDISNAIPTLLVLKPSGVAVSQILNVKDNLVYGNLNNSLKNEVGTYIAKLMLVEGNKKTFISNISYEVTENALLGKIDDDIVEDERYSVLLQLLERLSNIELQEQTRVDNESSRVEAENLREESIEKIKNDIANLINETNKKVDNNLNINTSKIDNLVIETKEELNEYKSNKDISIDEDLKEFKENTNKSIQDYKTSKDIEINNSLNTYKTNTTNDINSFKNTINSEINKYKNDKDKAINEYIEAKELELDNYVEAKNKEIDNYKTSKSNELDLYVSEKNTLIDSKISEVDNAKEQLQNSVNNKLVEVDNAEQIRQQEHESRQQFLNGFEGKLNTVVDDVATIKDDVVSVREANKRQDVFLQGLYNENLDGRVTVKEEGSVISLTNSDDGLVDVVGLEGNTLVNYVQDGAKELTLNGDIEAEGTNVTLTEGADNGLVDVALEGNTMVNLANIRVTNFHWGDRVLLQELKPNTVYTFIVDISNPIIDSKYAVGVLNKNTNSWSCINDRLILGNTIFTMITDDAPSSTCRIGCTVAEAYADFDIMILEGDWTNKEIPPYFEGMKSVGECEDNKLEILSQNKNLFNGEYELGYIDASKGYVAIPNASGLTTGWIKCKPNTKYRASGGDRNRWLLRNKDGKETIIGGTTGNETPTVTTLSDTAELRCYFRWSSSNEEVESVLNSFQIEEGDTHTTYTKGLLNKKEITLSEPLRALPNGVKDKIVKIGGKWYIQRNTGEVTFDGDENFSTETTPDYFRFISKEIINAKNFDKRTECLFDKFIFSEGHKNKTGFTYMKKMYFYINECSTVDEFKTWLQTNPTTIVYELESPTYEPLEIEPTLNTYNDITHISNNSTIPCNMTVKNTGYNAIIKPSTQYTVAFDTDKSGEVGINLGGSKVTTTNNVATITTPSTLIDDSLRLTGKGIKASKVRLLEGDKTNWIPSYFEGMKSSFEDKLQDDGSYKMEILSNNGNLINLEEQVRLNKQSGMNCSLKEYNGVISWEIHTQPYIEYYNYLRCQYKPNTQYTMYFDCNMTPYDDRTILSIKVMYENDYDETFTINKDTKNVQFTTLENRTVKKIYFSNWQYSGYVNIYNMKFCEGLGVLVEEKSNKIQLSSIEPLRGVGDVKDRFVFKDGKLMIERNVAGLILNGNSNENWVFEGKGISPDYKYNKTYRAAVKLPNSVNFNWGVIVTSDCSNCFVSDKFISKRITETNFNEDIEHFSFWDLGRAVIGINQSKLTEESESAFRQYLQTNSVTVVYKLAEPTYEEIPYELQKLILEGYINGTLFLDTNIPPTVEASYTANIPVVSKLNKVNETTETNTEDIAITQMAVDFLLMSSLGEEMLNFKVRSGYNMASYFASRIIKGALKYEDVINKYPQYKEDINLILVSEGYSDLIVEL